MLATQPQLRNDFTVPGRDLDTRKSY